MAQCKVAAKDFIINAFSPQVAAVCSNNAEATCQKNNLSFIELLQPFCRINTEGNMDNFIKLVFLYINFCIFRSH